MDEKVEEPQEQAAERPPIHPELLRKILEAHRKWVESEREEGERASLHRTNLQGADLRGAKLQKANLYRADLQGADLWVANLQGADLRDSFFGKTTGLTASQVKKATNWELAFYSDDFINKLGLKHDHNEIVKKKLAELEKGEKGTGEK